MSVFRRTRKDEKDSKYTIQFRDHAGLVRRIGAFRDKKASEELERGILRLTALRASGATPDAEAARFLESMPVAIRDSLVTWGVIDSARAAGGKSLDSLIVAWERHMEAREFSEQHRFETASRVHRLFASCRFRVWSDIDAGKVESRLA